MIKEVKYWCYVFFFYIMCAACYVK